MVEVGGCGVAEAVLARLGRHRELGFGEAGPVAQQRALREVLATIDCNLAQQLETERYREAATPWQAVAEVIRVDQGIEETVELVRIEGAFEVVVGEPGVAGDGLLIGLCIGAEGGMVEIRTIVDRIRGDDDRKVAAEPPSVRFHDLGHRRR